MSETKTIEEIIKTLELRCMRQAIHVVTGRYNMTELEFRSSLEELIKTVHTLSAMRIMSKAAEQEQVIIM